MPDDDRPPASAYSEEDRSSADNRIFEGEGNTLNTGWFANRYGPAIQHATVTMHASGANNHWIPRGPRNVGGRIRAIVQDTVTPARFFAGSAFGGLWRTENSGDTWSSVDISLAPGVNAATHVEAAYPVGAIGLCHHKPNNIYVGTGEPVRGKFSGTGLYFSDDGGARFTRIAGPGMVGFSQRYETIVVDPWNENRIWVASPLGLFRRSGVAPHALIREPLTGTEMPPVGAQDITDVAIHFGNRSGGPPSPGDKYTIYIAMRARRKSETPGDAGFEELHAGGIYRSKFDPATERYSAWERLHNAQFPFPVMPDDTSLTSTEQTDINKLSWALRAKQRIKLSICENHPATIYMVAGLGDNKASHVFRSEDSGDTWSRTAERPNDTGTQAYYDLFVTAHPDDPDICITGSVEVWRTLDGGESWQKTLNKDLFRKGDRAQHADQHALIYDNRDPRRIWLANDHGISESKNLGGLWRTRSFGIQATMFFDITTHPTYPWIFAGGFQDNGSWISFGGTSWMVCGVADGGAVAFQPERTDVFLVTHQAAVSRAQIKFTRELSKRPPQLGGFSEIQGFKQLWHSRNGNRLPDQPSIEMGGDTFYPLSIVEVRELNNQFNADDHDLFGHKIIGHPVRQDRFIAAEFQAGYHSTSGSINGDEPDLDWTEIEDDEDNDLVEIEEEVTALAIAPTQPAVAPSPASDNNWWIGTEGGKIYFTKDGGTRWHDATTVFWSIVPGKEIHITDIAIHPRNPDIVAITLGRDRNNVIISGDARATDADGVATSTWKLLSHVAGATHVLPNSPVTRVVFDGDRALGSGDRDPLTLFVATLVGVFVSTDVRASGAGNAQWSSFNTDLPLLLLRDLEYSESHEVDGTIRRRVLRAGTYGRGLYECDLDPAGVPAARLMIRSTVIDDSYDYIARETVLYDPRLNVPGQAALPYDLTKSIDIRIDPPPYEVFGDTLDSVEFDEDLRSGTLVLGETNFIYVQVHTRGHEELSDVDVHLYFADATGDPPIAPSLNPSFWDTFPGPQPPAAAWQVAGTDRQSELHSGQPRVFRIEWTPPITLGKNVALVAIATHPNDSLAGLASLNQPTRNVHPSNLPNSLTVSERRVALYITPTRRVTPDVYVRDGLDDTGTPGAVAWGGRGADIIVTDAAVADPAADFDDPTALRPDDRVTGGQTNHIYVRAFNRSNAVQTIEVDVFAVAYATLTDASTWVQIGATQPIVDVPANGVGFNAGLVWSAGDIADPAPGVDHKAYLLIALIGSGDDPRPDPASIRTLSEFWAFFRGAENANNASFRAIAFIP